MRTVILVLFVSILIAGTATGVLLYFGKNTATTKIVPPQPQSLLLKNTKPTLTVKKEFSPALSTTQPHPADNLLQNFYDYYLACLQAHDAITPRPKQPTQSPIEDCPYNQTGALTDKLALQLKPIIAYNPVFCSQTLPSQITYSPVQITGDKGKAIVHEEFQVPTTRPKTAVTPPPPLNITVQLESQNYQWQIANITCPI
jgi:hypothetical protein